MARNKSEVEKPAETPLLKCPKCDNASPARFEYWEEVIASREVIGFDENGALQIDGSYEIGDDGENGRLFCLACYAEFRIPHSINIDWV